MLSSISKEKNKEIVDLYTKKKLSMQEIAIMYNVSITSIRTILNKVTVGRKASLISDDTAAMIYNLYCSGKSIIEISDELNIFKGSVKRCLLRRYKIVTNYNFSQYEKNFEKIVNYLNNGSSPTSISKKLNFNASTLIDFLIYKDILDSNYNIANSGLIKCDYFKELDRHSAYYLGVAFSIAKLERKDTVVKKLLFRVGIKKFEIIKLLADEIFEIETKICKSNSFYYIKVSSKEFIDSLYKYGLFEEIKNIPNELITSFWDGYFLNCSSMSVNGFNILFSRDRSSYIDFAKSYLINDVKIKECFIKKNETSLSITDIGSIIKLSRNHPVIYDNILYKKELKEIKYLL